MVSYTVESFVCNWQTGSAQELQNLLYDFTGDPLGDDQLSRGGYGRHSACSQQYEEHQRKLLDGADKAGLLGRQPR